MGSPRAHRHPRPARPARPGGGQLLVPGQPARVRVPRRRHRRRHPRQLHPAGRVPLRQHDDPRHGGARRHLFDVTQAALPRQLVHLPARGRASRSPRTSCSPARSSPPTRPTPSPRSPASSSARPTARQYGCDFISAMPTNLYGPDDNFDLAAQPRAAGADAQVPRGQGRRRRARSRSGARGTPRREFLHVDDLADACLFLMEHYDERRPHQRRHRRGPHASASWPRWSATSCTPRPSWSSTRTKPDGTPRKLLDVSRLHALGWRHRIALREGIAETYEWFLEQDPARLGGFRSSLLEPMGTDDASPASERFPATSAGA